MTHPPAPPAKGSWKIQAISALGEEGFLRAFGTKELGEALRKRGLPSSDLAVYRALGEWEMAGLVKKVSRGVYLNMQAFPQPLPQEAAPLLRPGAVISLATVLGDAGVLNNPTPWVMAVLPAASNTRHATEVSSVPGFVFKFAYLQPAIYASPDLDWAKEAYNPRARVPTATPEKALLDWIYLSSVGKSAARWRLPASHDIDMDYLDSARLDRLAEHMGLQSELAQFRQSLDTNPTIRIRRMRP